MNDADILIRRLRVDGGSQALPTGPAALKVGLEQTLRQLRPRPARLPPRAILIIRRLEADTSFAGRDGDPLGWLAGVEAQIETLVRHAVRPEREYVPPDAVSVWFADEVDLLRCFTRHLLTGQRAWYWLELFPTITPGRPSGDALATAWLRYPRAWPAALVALRPQEATAALTCLDKSWLARLARQMHETFDLPPLPAGLPGVSPAMAPPRAGRAKEMGRLPIAAPWEALLPAGHTHALEPATAYVLGMAHALVKRPHLARQAPFASQAARWLAEALPEALPLADQLPDSPPLEEPATPAVGGGKSAGDAVQAAWAGSVESARDNSPLPSGQPPVPATQNVELPSNDAIDAMGTSRAGEAAPGTRHAPFATDGVLTRLGGVLYLVNLFDRLHLLEAMPALAALDPWALLGGLASALLESDPALADDRLWEALRALSGLAPGGLWGAELPPPEAFYLPATWVALLPPTAVARQRCESGRQRLWATAPPYLLADIPASAGGDFAATPAWRAWRDVPRAARAPQPERPLEMSAAGVGAYVAPALGWWLSRLRPFIVQLMRSLCNEPDADITRLLQRPATLYLSRTHVDLLLGLEQISLPLRRAGLDQSPGWQPDFGHIITFHFE